jgi:hypothetical protein
MLAMGVVVFALVLNGTDVSATFEILAATGLLLPLALFPYLGQIGFDALSWRTLLAGLDRHVTWRRLLAVRLSTEAVLMSMPAGSIVGETLKPYLLVKTDWSRPTRSRPPTRSRRSASRSACSSSRRRRTSRRRSPSAGGCSTSTPTS